MYDRDAEVTKNVITITVAMVSTVLQREQVTLLLVYEGMQFYWN